MFRVSPQSTTCELHKNRKAKRSERTCGEPWTWEHAVDEHRRPRHPVWPKRRDIRDIQIELAADQSVLGEFESLIDPHFVFSQEVPTLPSHNPSQCSSCLSNRPGSWHCADHKSHHPAGRGVCHYDGECFRPCPSLAPCTSASSPDVYYDFHGRPGLKWALPEPARSVRAKATHSRICC
jgi:hypothetical protein